MSLSRGGARHSASAKIPKEKQSVYISEIRRLKISAAVCEASSHIAFIFLNSICKVNGRLH